MEELELRERCGTYERRDGEHFDSLFQESNIEKLYHFYCARVHDIENFFVMGEVSSSESQMNLYRFITNCMK